MGWIPLGGDAGHRLRTELIAEGAPGTLYVNGPHAVYSPVSNRTFVAYLGLNRDLYITEWDHTADEQGATLKIGDRVISANDDHSPPSITIDPAGILHIVWASHNSLHRALRSNNPHDISAWTTQTLSGAGTYPQIRYSSDALYIFDRAGSSHGSTFPSHEFAGMRKSTDGGVTWSASTPVIDGRGFPESHCDIYLEGADVASDGRIHLAWLTARGNFHDHLRRDWYHAIFDPSDEEMYAIDGTSLGAVVDATEMQSNCRVAVDDQTDAGHVRVVGGEVVTNWFSVDLGTARIARWDGADWVVSNALGAAGIWPYPVKDAWRGMVITPANGNRNVAIYGANPESFDEWVEHEVLLLGTTGNPGFGNRSGIHGPPGYAVGLAMERNNSNYPSNATASDLFPIYMVFDEASREYAGEVGVGDHTHPHDHDDVYAVIGHDHDGDYQPIDRVWMPLTTVDDSEPVLVWEDDDSLIPTEVPI